MLKQVESLICTTSGLECFILKQTGYKVGSYNSLHFVHIVWRWRGRTSKYFWGNTHKNLLEIPIVAKIWNVTHLALSGEAKEMALAIIQHSYKCLSFYLSFPLLEKLHSSFSVLVVLPPKTSQDQFNGHCITVLLTSFADDSLTNPAILHATCLTCLWELFFFFK